MKANPTILLIFTSFVFGGVFVVLIKPFSGGFYANTFFEVPYPFAYVFVPFASALATYVSTHYITNHRPYTVGGYKSNIIITVMAFYVYGLLHAVGVAITNSFMLAPAIFFAFLIFGSLFVLPACIIVTIFVTWLYCTITLTTRSSGDRRPDGPPAT